MTRKLSIFAALVVAYFLSAHPVSARYVGANTLTTVTQPDIWCNGGTNQGSSLTATEACLDYAGNLIPTTNNSQQLGESALQWKDVEAANINSGGGPVSIGGVVTQTGNEILSGLESYSQSVVGAANSPTQGIYISTVIPVTTAYIILTSSGGNLTMTSTPSITTNTVVGGTVGIPNGTYIVLTTTMTNTITLQDQGTLSGSLLALGASTRAISKTKTLSLIFNTALARWLEVAYGNNQGN